MIPYGRQLVDEDDIAAVVAVLRGDWLTQGPAVDEFEASLCGVTGARFAVAYANGTLALQAAMFAAEIGPGSIVATSPLSFVASASCALWFGADVRFVDIDPETLNLDLAKVPECDALVVVHYAGLPVDLSKLKRRPRIVVEDAAHALGGATPAGPVGNCADSDMAVLSFHPVKSVTTGEGGAVTTNSPELAARLRRFRTVGIERKPEHGGWYYEISDLAPNARITDMQCALGTSQLKKLPRYVERRDELAARYRALLADVEHVELPPVAPFGTRHAYHLFAVRVPERRSVYDALHANGVGTQVHYVPIYRHPLFARMGFTPKSYPETERAYAALLSLPLHPGLTDADQDHVIVALTNALDEAYAPACAEGDARDEATVVPGRS
jgi:dTDP-4-amino-4,6-dideoxygalactose transaminase